jgi:lysophospholipase L1-like esterase
VDGDLRAGDLVTTVERVMKFRSFVILGALALIGSACASTLGPPVTDDAATDPAPTPATTSSTAAPPAPPSTPPTTEPTPEVSEPPENVPPIVSPRTFSVQVGESVPLDITAFDSDGRVENILWFGLPPRSSTAASGEQVWTPDDAGTWIGSYEIVDDDGATSVADVAFVARYPSNRHALVAMGDSVPSGHGLQESDYLGRDDCWRDGGEAYPRRVFDALVAAGELAAERAELALVACSGHDTDDLFETPVTGGLSETAPDGVDKLSQLEWAVRANPAIVTLTIGANDTGFVGPAKLLLADHSLDRADVARRMDVIRADLRIVLDRLVSATDAEVYVTNYYDPTAVDPQGVPGCRQECFAEKAAEVVGAMNDTIAEVVAEFGPRVRLVDIHTPFVGHGAPNGLGPDGLRAGGFGVLGSLVGRLVADVHPYCAHGDAEGEPWINSIDCVHPDGTGTQVIADAVTAAILG